MAGARRPVVLLARSDCGVVAGIWGLAGRGACVLHTVTGGSCLPNAFGQPEKKSLLEAMARTFRYLGPIRSHLCNMEREVGSFFHLTPCRCKEYRLCLKCGVKENEKVNYGCLRA